MSRADRADVTTSRVRIFALAMMAGGHLASCAVMFALMLSPSDDLWNAVAGIFWVAVLGAGLGGLCAEVCWTCVRERPGHQPAMGDRLRAMVAGAALGVASLTIAPIPFILFGLWMVPPLMFTEGMGAFAALGAVGRIMGQRPLRFLGAQCLVMFPVALVTLGPPLLGASALFINSRNPYASHGSGGGGPAGDLGGFVVILLLAGGFLAVLALAVLYSVPALGMLYREFVPRAPEEAPG
jgi:hypothetical protein